MWFLRLRSFLQFGKQARGLVLNKEFFILDVREKKGFFLTGSIDVDVIAICQSDFHCISKMCS